jgi:hypothetical protein
MQNPLRLAFEHHRQGRLVEAALIYRTALSEQPGHIEAPPCSMADRMRVTSLMRSARATEEVGWYRFYQPRVAIAIERQGAKAPGWHNELWTITRVGPPAEVWAARFGLIDEWHLDLHNPLCIHVLWRIGRLGAATGIIKTPR